VGRGFAVRSYARFSDGAGNVLAPIAPSRDAGGRIRASGSVTAIGARGTAGSRFASSGFLVGGLSGSRSKGGMPREPACETCDAPIAVPTGLDDSAAPQTDPTKGSLMLARTEGDAKTS
jgi:hypothetical protein